MARAYGADSPAKRPVLFWRGASEANEGQLLSGILVSPAELAEARNEGGGLDALRALSDAATPGPWSADETTDQFAEGWMEPADCPRSGWFREGPGKLDVGDYNTLTWADAAFIVAAVNYVRARLRGSESGEVES